KIQKTSGISQVEKVENFAKEASETEMLVPLKIAIKDLNQKYGNWQIPWGEINRFQRINGEIEQKFDDEKPSLPIAFVSNYWGMIPAYSSSFYQNSNKRYGKDGNSFVCAVEFGEKVKAKSLLAGGN